MMAMRAITPPPAGEGNENAYLDLCVKYPAYPWGKPAFCDAKQRPIGKQTKIKHKGRPLLTNENKFSAHLWPVFARYIHNLVWEDSAISRGCTFAEMAIDFETTTGLNICCKVMGNKTTWAKKAEVMRIMMKHCSNFHSKYEQPKFVKKVRTLAEFGIAIAQSGVACRPVFWARRRPKK